MPYERDSGQPASPPQDESAEGPVRPVDDHRWQASWDRFQAAHDENDEVLNTDDPGIANGQPAAAPVDAMPPAAPVAAVPTAAVTNRTPRHQRPKVSRTIALPGPAISPPPVSAAVAEPPPDPDSDLRPSSAEQLSSQSLLRPRQDQPAKGWRRVLHNVTGGSVNPGVSATEQRERDVLRRITTPVDGCHRIAVISLKGGVGKTTTTACLGLTLAHHRGDRVVALDANPDSGTLAERLSGQGGRSVGDLLADVGDIRSFTDIASYTSLVERLQVLGSQQEPEMSRAFDEHSYRAVDEVLARFFNIVLVDSGTGVLHSAMTGTLGLANSLVVVAGPTVDGAGRAAKTLDWLVVHGYGGLVARSVAVISSVRPDTGDVNVNLVRSHFEARCRRVVEIPYDPHLATGGRIDRALWRRPTADAFVEAGAAVAEGFAHPAADSGGAGRG